MKAVRIDGPELTSLANVDEPALGEGDVEISVAYVGYCGS